MAKVMIVDEDETKIPLIKTLLELDDFEVVYVTQGTEVIEAAYRELPDWFVISERLVDMDSAALVARIRAEGRFARTPIRVI